MASYRCKIPKLCKGDFASILIGLNLILIVIVNPSIINPGPTKPISVYYQNVRGFVPFSELNKQCMDLNCDKLYSFQSHIYQNQYDIVILNETWLSKEHKDAELFPRETYKVYRLDRSKRNHPPDPIDPKKFRSKGGGIIIAVKSNTEIETKVIEKRCKAEIISVEFKNKKLCFCITTCYRVGTLGVPNYKEIDKYLRTISAIRKYKAHFIIGDLNLSSVDWDNLISTNNTENMFLDLFSDLGLSQQITEPTHKHGRILDLLLTNVPGYVKDITVNSTNDPCYSDHFSITFKLETQVKNKYTKREIYNYKKANWDALNSELNETNWNSLLYGLHPETAWNCFKNISFGIIDKYIPKVTIKNNDQPPWFDHNAFKLCKKKESLHRKYKATKLKQDYNAYSKCRK